jgi:hypothetical protein
MSSESKMKSFIQTFIKRKTYKCYFSKRSGASHHGRKNVFICKKKFDDEKNCEEWQIRAIFYSFLLKKSLQINVNRIVSEQELTSGEWRSAQSHNILTYSRSWDLLEEPLIGQPLKNFPAVHGTRRFNTVFTRAPHWSLPWAISIQSTLL